MPELDNIKTAMTQVDAGVATQHPQYTSHVNMWKRCRDVIAGSDAIKNAGITYLPKLSNQSDNDYVAYVLRANFYNATARTISGLIGMLYRKPPTNDSPPALDDLLADIDMCGTPFDVFSQIAAQENLSTGRIGILVDHSPAVTTPTGQVLTVAVAQKAGLRPTMKMYFTESIINWRFDRINNAWTLVQVVLKEQQTVPAKDATGRDSEFANITQDVYRVLDLFEGKYRNRLFTRKNGTDEQIGADLFPLMNNQPMNYIPFIVINQDGIGWDVLNPPLLDLVDVNLSHYKTSADYEHGCHFTGVPTFYIAGYQPPIPDGGGAPEKIYLGSQAAIVLPDPNGKVGFAEFTGQGLGSLVSNLDRKESQMAILGARMLATEGKQAMTATTTAIHRTGENSSLASISISMSLGLSKALCIFASWAGVEYDCKYQLNRDFLPVTVDGPTLLAMMQNWQAGAINDEEYFDWLQRGDLIEAEVSFDDHKAGTFQDPTKLLPPPATKTGTTGDPPIKTNPEKP